MQYNHTALHRILKMQELRPALAHMPTVPCTEWCQHTLCWSLLFAWGFLVFACWCFLFVVLVFFCYCFLGFFRTSYKQHLEDTCTSKHTITTAHYTLRFFFSSHKSYLLSIHLLLRVYDLQSGPSLLLIFPQFSHFHQYSFPRGRKKVL